MWKGCGRSTIFVWTALIWLAPRLRIGILQATWLNKENEMRKRLGYFALIGFCLLFAGCATTTVPGLQLIGNYANPANGILAGLCNQCNANACLDWNAISGACANGLPIQGLAGKAVLGEFCSINGYPQATSFTPLQVPASCLTPPAA
jgi:hypothetical protein